MPNFSSSRSCPRPRPRSAVLGHLPLAKIIPDGQEYLNTSRLFRKVCHRPPTAPLRRQTPQSRRSEKTATSWSEQEPGPSSRSSPSQAAQMNPSLSRLKAMVLKKIKREPTPIRSARDIEPKVITPKIKEKRPKHVVTIRADYRKDAIWLLESSALQPQSKEQLKLFLNELENLKNQAAHKVSTRAEKILRHCESARESEPEQRIPEPSHRLYEKPQKTPHPSELQHMLRIARGMTGIEKSSEKRRAAAQQYRRHLSSVGSQSLTQMNIFSLRSQFDKGFEQPKSGRQVAPRRPPSARWYLPIGMKGPPPDDGVELNFYKKLEMASHQIPYFTLEKGAKETNVSRAFRAQVEGRVPHFLE